MHTGPKTRTYATLEPESWGSNSSSRSTPTSADSPRLEDNAGTPTHSKRSRSRAPALQPPARYANAPLPWWAVLLLQLGQAGVLYCILAPPPPVPPNAESLWRAGWAATVGTFGLCTPEEKGELHFDVKANAFVGCDGRAWSKLAFCCAPERPDAPELSLMPVSASSNPNALRVMWTPPAARGSPVISYSLHLVSDKTSSDMPVSDGELCQLGRVVCEGMQLSCIVNELNTSVSHTLWLVAHAPGGSSQASPPVTLHPAPRPVSLIATDNGDCSFGPDDTLELQFNLPTNRAFADAEQRRLEVADVILEPDTVATLLGFSAGVGPMRGRWNSLGTKLTLWLDPMLAKAAPSGDIYLAEMRVRLKPEGRVMVMPPGVSLAADTWSPPLVVPGCFVDGFEVGMLRWFAEASDPESYNISVDAITQHSGRRALRIEGGNGGQFDGLTARLPLSSPRGVSCWVRTSVAANVGYLALGGPSLHESVVFFHLRPTGQAGLLSANGYFQGGNYSIGRWLHIELSLDWERRTADLRLDGNLVASHVGFVSGAHDARMIHIFNSDTGVVWWDDFVVK